ncbi:helix-turn-helix domain-containing protein [Vibrio stylophorae]|nr:AraC family transcriptional regulator [Vibrio stylophorae]
MPQSPQQSAPLAECFYQLEPGLAVCWSHSTNAPRQTFRGNAQYVHLNCMLDGELNARIDQRPLYCRTGDLITGLMHGKQQFHVLESAYFSCLSVMVAPHYMTRHWPQLANFNEQDTGFVYHTYHYQKAFGYAQQLCVLLQHPNPQHLLIHAAVLNYIYWHFQAFARQDQPCRLTAHDKMQLRKARSILLTDLSLAPSLAELADAVGLSLCKLKRGYKALYQTSIYADFQQERMEKAQQLLHSYNVTETATTLGYSNMSHFSAAFRKQFAITPSQYKNQLDRP